MRKNTVQFPTYSATGSRFFDSPQTQREVAKRHQLSTSPHSAKYRINIIGCGMIGREHMRVATLLGKAEVHGIFDTQSSSMEQAEAEFSAYSSKSLLRYASLEAACFDSAVDVLFICTPNYTHFDVLQTALQSGKALFVEKPMATTLADAIEIVRRAEEYSNFVQLGMQYRYKAQYSEAFHRVKKLNQLGSVKMISVSEYRPPFLDKVHQWNKFNENSGGTLVEKCCHYFDLINMMAEAKPLKVFATGGQAVNFIDFKFDGKQADIDDHAFVLIEYANGIRASFTLNMFSQELYEEMIVSGDKGRLVASENSSFMEGRTSNAKLVLENDAEAGAQSFDLTYAELVERSGHHGATFFEHEALIDRLEGRPEDSATALQGLWAIIVASAAQASIESGEPIMIDEYIQALKIEE